MQSKRYAAHIVIAGFIVFLGSATAALATPSDEIGHAFPANDVSNVQQGSTRQFIRAFSTVPVRVGAKEAPSCCISSPEQPPGR